MKGGIRDRERSISRSQHYKRKRFVSILLAVILVAGNSSVLSFAEQKPICGKTEHKHTESCYKEQKTLVCEKEESEEHSHVDSCYKTEKVLVCDMEEHTHSSECYATEETNTSSEKKEETISEATAETKPETEEAKSETEATKKEKDNSQDKKESSSNQSRILTVTTDEATATATCEEDVLPEGATLHVTSVGKTEQMSVETNKIITDTLEQQGKKTTSISVYDIAFYDKDGNEVEPSGNITIELKLNQQIEATNENAYWKLYHIAGTEKSEEKNSVEDLTIDDTTQIYQNNQGAVTGFTLETDRFSPFAVVEVDGNQTEITEEQKKTYEAFLEELKEIEKTGITDSATCKIAEALQTRIEEAYQKGEIAEAHYKELSEKIKELLVGYYNTVAESAEGDNWKKLKDSGWFNEYSGASGGEGEGQTNAPLPSTKKRSLKSARNATVPPSDVQVAGRGGTNTSEDGSVTVSKTIAGTDLENVFDITLQVDTTRNISEIIQEPDMAVVIVMDISNTMKENFGNTSRYAAAMTAAEAFLDSFAENNSLGISKVGFVAFNTDAHEIFELQPCTNADQANAIKNTMRTETGEIINQEKYAELHSRFTNVQAGLKMGADMLNGVSNKNKYIVFLSDGFPTTYISSGYSGYDPYDSAGARFKDHVLNKPCAYGTSYSDEAAIQARNQAASIKASGTKIFSIGVDVGGQTIQKYITQSESSDGFSVVDRTSTTYEIGDASSKEAYKNWLGNSIGSGHYYDSTDSAGLTAAFKNIFKEIKSLTEQASEAQWVASDPMPTVGDGGNQMIEFIQFYDKTPTLVSGNLTGSNASGGENTAKFDLNNQTIRWDLKNSGYRTTTVGTTTTYIYSLKYRVRLKNEETGFNEGTIYNTNGTTSLQYVTIEESNGIKKVSDPKTVDFPIPSVKGYLAEFTFQKVDNYEKPVAGAEFTLTHNEKNCSICHGDGTSTKVPAYTATSDANGNVSFQNIPSGHIYTLEETKVPAGYHNTNKTYTVTVAYDSITVTGGDGDWNGKIVNETTPPLPKTGGPGTHWYIVGGTILLLGAGILLIYNEKKRREQQMRP